MQRLEAATQERMRRLCGVRDGSQPREDAAAVKMRLMMTSQVDSSNQSGIAELKEELSVCCRGLPFVGESAPMSWIRVDAAINKLQQQSLTVFDACREILNVMKSEPQVSSSAAKTALNEDDVLEAAAPCRFSTWVWSVCKYKSMMTFSQIVTLFQCRSQRLEVLLALPAVPTPQTPHWATLPESASHVHTEFSV